jgi:hypothetical protein
MSRRGHLRGAVQYEQRNQWLMPLGLVFGLLLLMILIFFVG